jgi:hypothetical protein
MAKEKPAATFRIGNVKATIWNNGEHYNVTFIRAYKDGDDNWKDGDSFSHYDLLNLSKVAERAEEFISAQ